MKHLRYYADWLSRDNVAYRIEIWQEAAEAYEPRGVTLSAEPVTIEWGECEKFEPVAGSSATVNLISMSDREFADLYTVEPCAIRLDIYRAGALYWSGTLDTELFEEPYSYDNRYVTTVTFSDFAVLDRLRWDKTDAMTLGAVLDTCVGAAGINHAGWVRHVSTSRNADGTGDILSECTISGLNFYDEDGEAWSIREVLDEVLRPFALRLRQKGGRMVLADINALAGVAPSAVEWRAADATLGVEPTYNRAEVTLSPYSDTVLYDGALDYDEVELSGVSAGEGAAIVPLPDTDFTGFTIYFGRAYGELTKVQNIHVGGGARLFKIRPEEDGSEEAGIMWGIRPAGDTWLGERPVPLSDELEGTPEQAIMQSPRIPITSSSEDYRLRIELDVLFDPRINPFEAASVANEEGNWEDFNRRATIGGVAGEVTLYGLDGKTYKCDNISRGLTDGWQGVWEEAAEGKTYRIWLEYYNTQDRVGTTGFGGWQTNKRTVGFVYGKLSSSVTLHVDGVHLPMPPVPGDMEVKIFAGIMTTSQDYEGDMGSSEAMVSISRWLLYKDLKVSLVKRSGADVEAEDMVLSAWINRAAEEEFKVTTYIGTPSARIPMARGSILSPEFEVIRNFTRAGVTDTLERLLIGSVYSNYARRMSTIGGTVKLIPEAEVLSDRSMLNKVYMILSETQNLATETSEVKLAEIAADSYEVIEYGKV